MELSTKENVPAVAAVLSVVSLALVFAAVLRLIPASLLPHAGDAIVAAIPHVNAAISALALVVIGGAWRAIRRGNVARHRRGMLAGVGLFAAFLVLYLYKVILEGPTEFAGPAAVDTYLYLPALAVHILLAVVCVPLLYYVLLLALTRPVGEIPSTNHLRIGRVAASLWLISFALGILVYLLLYVVY